MAELAAKQASILAAAATLVKPGGRLVYATCSVLPEENEAIVDAFLAAHPRLRARATRRPSSRAPDIALDTGPALKLLPHVHGCDGFFAAVLTSAHALRSPYVVDIPIQTVLRNRHAYRHCSVLRDAVS